MSTRTITLEFDEKFFALMEERAAYAGYASVPDYVIALVAAPVFNKYEALYGLGNYPELQDHEAFKEVNYDDDFPF